MTTKSDQQLQQDVQRELRWDTRLDESNISVAVEHGVVVLSGAVSSWPARAAARDAAHRVVGVHDVANELKVRLPGPAGRTDAELAEVVRSALQWDTLVPDEHIHSTVTDGEVLLQGNVDFSSQREDAERAIANIIGVRSVVNEIKLKKASLKANEVLLSIENALARQVEREVHRIKVRIEEGTVDLDGTVKSWRERNAVIGAAKGTHGVAAVVDHLRIEP